MSLFHYLSRRWLLVGASLTIAQITLEPAKGEASSIAAPPHWMSEDRLHVAEGFTVKRVYSVPREQQGSWVSICADGQGHLYASAQYSPTNRGFVREWPVDIC